MRRLLAAGVAVLALAGCTVEPGDDLIEHIGPPPAASAPAPPVPENCDVRKSEAPDRAATGSAKLDQIRKRGRLVLGTSQDTLLFSSRNPLTGEIEGFDVDMGRRVAAAIFGDPGKIEIKVIGYDERVNSIVDGTVDLVADTMTITCDRKQHVGFSTVYYDAGQRVLVSTTSAASSLDDLGGKRVCAAAGSTSLGNIAKNPHGPQAVPRPDFASCLVAFQQNEVDAISTDDTILAGLAAQDPYTKVVGPKFTREPYGIAMPKDDKKFIGFVNQVLADDRADGTWKRTYEHWLGDFGPAPAPPRAEYLS
jgi:polar amino acid transport system substrate-binding protein